MFSPALSRKFRLESQRRCLFQHLAAGFLEEVGPELSFEGQLGKKPTEEGVCFPGYGVGVCKGLKVQQEKMKWFRKAREIGEDGGQSWQGTLVNLRRDRESAQGF